MIRDFIEAVLGEEWRPVPRYEGLYSASDHGRVFSHRKGLVMKPGSHPHGYHQYTLRKNGRRWEIRAHNLVALAFLGPPDGRVVRHKDDVPTNNHVDNLQYGTQGENTHDWVNRRGGQWPSPNRGKTHCIRSHEFTEENTRVTKSGRRVCRQCERMMKRNRRRGMVA